MGPEQSKILIQNYIRKGQRDKIIEVVKFSKYFDIKMPELFLFIFGYPKDFGITSNPEAREAIFECYGKRDYWNKLVRLLYQ